MVINKVFIFPPLKVACCLNPRLTKLCRRSLLRATYQTERGQLEQLGKRSIAIAFSILYIMFCSVRDTEHYEISNIKATTSASQADLKKIRC